MTLTPPAPISLPFGDATRWGSPFDNTELERHVTWCRGATSNAEKGKRLEALLAWLLSHVPGVRAMLSNTFSEDGSQEVDVTFFNDKSDAVFRDFGTYFIGECKNWSKPVDSGEVAWLYWKMHLGDVSDAILLAANGITNRHDRRQDAQSIVHTANQLHRRICVLTLDEVAGLTSVDDLRELIVAKRLSLVTRSALA